MCHWGFIVETSVMVTAMTVLIWAAISKCDWVRQAFLTRWHYWTVVFIWVQLVFPGDFRNSWQANSISTERYLAACVTSDSCKLWEVRGTQCWRTYYCGDRKTRLITQGETQTSRHLLSFCMFYLRCVRQLVLVMLAGCDVSKLTESVE